MGYDTFLTVVELIKQFSRPLLNYLDGSEHDNESKIDCVKLTYVYQHSYKFVRSMPYNLFQRQF